MVIPSSRSLLSRDKRSPLDTWNQAGVQENVFGNQIFYVRFTQRSSSKNSIWQRAKKPRSGPWSQKDEHYPHKWRQTKSRHNSSADVCVKNVDCEFYNTGWITTELHGRTANTANIGITIRQIPWSTIVVSVDNSIQKTSDYLFWFSILTISNWKKFSKFRDAEPRRLLLLWTRSSRIPTLRRRRSALEEQKSPQKRTGFYEEDRSPSWSMTTFEWLSLMIQYKIMLIYSLLLFMMTTFRNSIQDGTKFYCLCKKFPPMKPWKVCTNWGIRESAQLKNVLELYDVEIHQKIPVPNYQKLKTTVKSSVDQKLRLRNFDARHGKIESGAVI